ADVAAGRAASGSATGYGNGRAMVAGCSDGCGGRETGGSVDDGIVHPSGTHVLQSLRTAHIISMVTWVCLLAPSVTYAIVFFITQKPLTFTPSHCGALFSVSISLFFKILHTLCTIIFLLGFISLVFFYYSTSRRVLQAQQRQLASSNAKKLVKSRRNMLVLVSIFCVCFVPFHLVRLPYAFLWNSCSVDPVLYYLKEAATMLSVFNICLDPLVYFFLCKTFQAQVRKASRRTNIQQANTESQSTEEKLSIINSSRSNQ
uniref:G-protein coupled receptors family 1 profile domain-containing protein n=1 Tax=Maylandia zebra TaxID=106582 RepID=A0A3P9DTB3_9CICH